ACWWCSSATRGPRCTGRSRPRSGIRSAPGGCRAARRCLPRACSPPTSASRAASWSRPTSSFRPRATWPAARAGTRMGRPARPAAAPRSAPAQRPRIDLSYGRADVSSFPRSAWLRSIRGALTYAPNEVFGYLTGSGVPQLRTAVADYVNRVRGTLAQPDHIVICTGYAQGIALLIQLLAAGGARRLALEDPSSVDDALPTARAAGLEVIGVPVDRYGVRVDMLRDSDADAVVLTPSHQWPTGSVLSAENRAAVLAWATERDAVVVEDDY